MELASAQFDNLNRGGVHVGSHGNDKGLWVEFSMEPVLQGAESEKQGRPIYKDVPFITIDFPGDKTKKVKRPVSLESTPHKPSDPQRFPIQWSAFEAQKEQVQTGTPVTEWPPIGKSESLELKGMKIHTVEQLANLPDGNIGWLGGQALREKARLWLKNAEDGSGLSLLSAENEKLKIELNSMKEQMKSINTQFEKMKKENK